MNVIKIYYNFKEKNFLKKCLLISNYFPKILDVLVRSNHHIYASQGSSVHSTL